MFINTLRIANPRPRVLHLRARCGSFFFKTLGQTFDGMLAAELADLTKLI